MPPTSDRRRAVAALAMERSRQGAGRRLVTRSLGVVGLLLLLLGTSLWALGFFASPPAVADVRKLVDQQVAEYARVARGETSFASAPSFEPVMEKLRTVPPEYRGPVGEQIGRLFEARERAEMKSYFMLPPAQRQAELDRRIKADEARRQAREAEREKRNQARPAGQPGQPGQQAGGSRPGGGPGPAGPPPGTTAGRTRTEDSRNERSKRRIDRSTPEDRAQQAEYRRAMDARRTQLGIPSGGRRGG